MAFCDTLWLCLNDLDTPWPCSKNAETVAILKNLEALWLRSNALDATCVQEAELLFEDVQLRQGYLRAREGSDAMQ